MVYMRCALRSEFGQGRSGDLDNQPLLSATLLRIAQALVRSTCEVHAACSPRGLSFYMD